MNYLEINSGSKALRISKMAFGTASSFSGLSDREIFQLLDRFIDAGGNCIDTARSYLGGESERIIGEWIKKRKNQNSIILSSKGGHPLPESLRRSRLSRNDLEVDFHKSLDALQTDYIDIYWIHKDDRDHPADDVIDTLDGFIKSGKVGIIGCSNWHVDRIEQANQYAREFKKSGFAFSQIIWSFASTDERFYSEHAAVVMNDQEYEWYLKNKMPVFAYRAQAQSFFTKAAKFGISGLRADLILKYASSENLIRLEKVKSFAKEHELSISAVTLGYIIFNKLPSVVVFGCRNLEQLEDTLSAADITIDPKEFCQLLS